jgi:hypothetical protein
VVHSPPYGMTETKPRGILPALEAPKNEEPVDP